MCWGFQEISTRIHRARRRHSCVECGAFIDIGERYEKSVSLFEGNFQSIAAHTECASDAKRLVELDEDNTRPFLSDWAWGTGLPLEQLGLSLTVLRRFQARRAVRQMRQVAEIQDLLH